MQQNPSNTLIPQHLLQQPSRIQRHILILVPLERGGYYIGPVGDVFDGGEAGADLASEEGGEGCAGVFAGL